MLRNHIKTALRSLSKNKGYALINVGGLALGMAVALIIGMWVIDELSHDSYFTKRDKIAKVYRNNTRNGNINTNDFLPLPLEQNLRSNYGHLFEHLVMSSWNMQQFLDYKETSIPRKGNFMQSAAPELLDLKIIKGNRDGLREVNSIMLNESTARSLFGFEDPIGKVIKVDKKFDVLVTAVYEDIPFNTSFNDLTFIMPWKHYESNNEWVKSNIDNWGSNSFQLFVQVADNVTTKEATNSIADFLRNVNEDLAEFDPKLFLLPMEDWYLRSNFEQGRQVGGRIKYVWLFGIIGAIVLLLACINFMNLSTARSEKRAKEVGIRKSIGSARIQLIYQFLSESLVVCLFGYALALALVVLSLKSFSQIAQKQMEFPWSDFRFWTASLVFILITTLLAGSYPSLYLSSFHPVRALKGTFKSAHYSSLPRKALVVVQFTVSVAFIIGTVIIMRQINHAQDRPIGYDKEGLIQIPTFGPDFIGKTNLMHAEFINSGAVVNMSTSSAPTTEIWWSQSGFDWPGKPEGFQESFAWILVSPEYAETLKLNIVQGRNFSRERATDSLGILLNETAVRHMGLKNPVGQFVKRSDIDSAEPPLKIIGVVEDMIVESPYQSVMPAMYVYDRFGIINYYYLRLNPNESASKSLATIKKVFTKHFPAVPFQYQFVDNEYEKKFAAEQRLGTLSGIFTALAIFISCLGLLGLTSFVAEQRTKEIGVRKVLGATVFNMWNMLSMEFLKLVVLSCLFAVPIAYYVMIDWLLEYEYRIELNWWIFGLAILGALVLTLVTVSFHAIWAARQNPIKSLRME